MNPTIRPSFLSATKLALLAAVCLATDPSWSATITVPSEPAGSVNAYPFAFPSRRPFDDSRYQQAYDASQFGDEPLWITEISFDLAAPGFVQAATHTLGISTIDADINSLSLTDFDGNVGDDSRYFATVVIEGGVAPDVLRIPGESFYYDPGKGNLLLDVYSNEFGSLGGFPAHYASTTDSLGVVSRYYNTGNAGFQGWGLVTHFVTVPEPSATLLALAAALSAAGARRPTAGWTF